MIFIGRELSDSHSHFVTNIVASIGTKQDLIIDLFPMKTGQDIIALIVEHCKTHDEHYVIYNAYEDEDFFFYLKSYLPALKLITIFSDDEWRHFNYDRYLALYADVFTITAKENIQRYEAYGLKPFYMPWACNPHLFYRIPEQRKIIDVCFIGAAYGKRVCYIRFLIKNEIQVRVYGKGWSHYADLRTYWGGYLNQEEMMQVINSSKINLNFLWTSREQERCAVKGRTIELAACGAFQLCNDADELHEYGFADGRNIAVFRDQRELLDKVHFYLNHKELRTVIAQRAFEHVLDQHTWQQRFQGIFSHIEDIASPSYPDTYNILILIEGAFDHNRYDHHDRLKLHVVSVESDWKTYVSEMDGVMQLPSMTTLNFESICMMAFGLKSDQSDLIAANFYVRSGKQRQWIRFKDKIIDKKRFLLKLIPGSCMMFSGNYASKNGCVRANNVYDLKISYIEYPCFELSLSFLHKRLLQLHFAHYREPRLLLRSYLSKLQWNKALSLIIDKCWQKYLVER